VGFDKRNEATDMKLGCRAHDYGRYPAGELAEILARRGYNAAQLAVPKAIEGVADYGNLTRDQARELGAAFAGQGIEITVLGCYMDLSAPDPEVRRAGVEEVGRALALEGPMGAKMVGSETSYDRLTAEEKRARRALMTDSVLRILDKAARLNAVFAVEPVFWHPLESMDEVGALLDAAADPVHLKLIFDPVNVLKKRYQHHQTELWRSWLEEFGSRVAAMHIKDFVLDADTYIGRPLGEGLVDFSYLGQWLRGNRPDMPLLREEVQPGRDREDLAFLRNLLGKEAGQEEG